MDFQADVLENAIKSKVNSGKNAEPIKLNEFIDYIEMTFEQINSIDPYKISASRAFSLYHKAIEQNKRVQKMYNKK